MQETTSRGTTKMTKEELTSLQDCIAFSMENNDALGANEIIELDKLNRRLSTYYVMLLGAKKWHLKF